MEPCCAPGPHLPAFIEALKKAGLHFRNSMETGPGGKQIQVEDPDGNPVLQLPLGLFAGRAAWRAYLASRRS